MSMDNFTDDILLATAITSIQNGIEALESMKHKDDDELDTIRFAVIQAKLRCKGALNWLSDVKIEMEDEGE